MTASNLARVQPPPTPQRRATPTPPNRAQPSAPGVGQKVGTRSPYRVPLIITATAFTAVNLAGAPYYLADLAARVRHPWHQWLRPSGFIGQSAGILAFLIFCMLLLYPIRKRWKALAFTGSVAKWLDIHVAAALTLPLLLAIHAGWRAQGIIGLGFSAMMIVWVSGLIGRYVYTRIPRAKTGVELSLEEVTSQRRALIDTIAGTTGLERDQIERSLEIDDLGPRRGGLLATAARLLSNDVTRWRLTRRLTSEWQSATWARRVRRAALRDAVRLASREISLAQQARMLEETRRMLHWWHVAHRPFALTALIAVVIHVAVVVVVGATWFW